MDERTRIGRSKVMTPGLGLGTNKVGGLYPGVTDEDGRRLLDEALGRGIGYLDTAYGYGWGRSEEIIGQVLNGHDRSQVVLATKAGPYQGADAVTADAGGGRHEGLGISNDPAFLARAVDEALQRLQTDYIDVFFIHGPDADTPKDEAVGALTDARRAGKIGAIGVSNFSLEQLREADSDGQVDIVEDKYSLVHRDAEHTLFGYLREHHIAFSPYFPLASGLLAGKYGPDDLEHFRRFADYTPERYRRLVDAVAALRPIATAHDATTTQLVLAWYLANPDIAVVIPGARNAEQVDGIAASRDIALSDEEYARIDGLFPPEAPAV